MNGEASLLEGVSHTFGRKGDQLAGGFRRLAERRAGARRERRERQLPVDARQLGQVHQDAHDAVHLTSQAEWIARTGRALTGMQQPDHGIELVGERNRRPGHGGRAERLG